MEASSWLPLYGNLCCQLVAQPYCMTQDTMRGYLSQQVTHEPVKNIFYFLLFIQDCAVCCLSGLTIGLLHIQQSIEGLQRSCQLYCTLRAGRLSCYYSPEEIQAKMEPSLIIPINKVDYIFTFYPISPQNQSTYLITLKNIYLKHLNLG